MAERRQQYHMLASPKLVNDRRAREWLRQRRDTFEERGRAFREKASVNPTWWWIKTILLFAVVFVAAAALILGIVALVNVNSRFAFSEDHVVVYVDPTRGRDRYSGNRAATAVRTLGRAIERLGARSSVSNCTIKLLAGTTYDMGADTVLDFLPAMARCDRVIVRGARSSLVQDRVHAVSDFGPYNRWRRVETTNAALTAGDYEGAHIENKETGRIYVVAQNGAATIDTISGDVAGFETAFEAGTGVALTPAAGPSFSAGDTIELYKLSTRLTFQNELKLSIPFGKVEFQDLIMDGEQDSSWQNPASATHRVAFRGCHLTSRTDVDAPSTRPAAFAGSYFLEGCFLQGTDQGTAINRFEPGACISAESLWVNATSLTFMGDCHLYYLKATNLNRKMTAVDARVALYAAEFTDVDDFAFVSFVNSQTYARDVEATRTVADNTAAPGFNTAFDFRDASVARWDNLNVNITAVTTGPGAMRVANSKLHVSNFDISAFSDVFTVLIGAELTLGGGPTPRTSVYESTALRCVLAAEGSQVYLYFNQDHVMTCGADGITAISGSKVTVGGTAPATITANTGGNVLTLGSGSTGTGTLAALTQAGAGALLQVGANPAGNWLTQTDFAAGSPQLCALYTATPIP